MSNDLTTIFAGFDRCEAMVLDSAGVMSGVSPTLATGATGSSGFRLLAAKDAQNLGAPEPEVVAITGDDAYQGGFIFPSAQPRQFMLTAAVMGFDVNAYMGVGQPYAIGNAEVSVLDSTPFGPINLAMIVTSQQKSAAGSNIGVGLFGGHIIPQIQGIPLGRQTYQERAAGIMRFKFIMSQAAQFPWGETFRPNTNQINANLATYVPWTANYRKAFFTARGDAATTTFGPHRYQAASTSLSDFVVYVNGYRRTANVTVNQSAQTFTFSVAPAASDKICVWYDTTG